MTVQSDSGKNYIMVAYYYNGNIILITPLKNRTWTCIYNGITIIHDKLRNRGLTTKPKIRDNEVSEDLNQYYEETDKQLQLFPPHMNHCNSEEQEARTSKNHFIDALCTVDPHLPFYLWDRLLPQVTTTHNMLQQYQLNPELS